MPNRNRASPAHSSSHPSLAQNDQDNISRPTMGRNVLKKRLFKEGGFAARDGRRSLLQQHRDRKAQALASRDADDVDQRWAL